MPAGLPVAEVEVDVVAEVINKTAATEMATAAAVVVVVVAVDMATGMVATSSPLRLASNPGSHPRRPAILGSVLACRLRRLPPMLLVVGTTKGMATRDMAARTTGTTATHRGRRHTEATREVVIRGAAIREAATKEAIRDSITRLTARAKIGVTTTGTTATTGIIAIHGDTGIDDIVGAAVRETTCEGWYYHTI